MIKKQDKELFEEMKIDCKKCFGLCCVALYFSASEGFPKDKEAGISCINLKSDFTCLVHENLSNKGFKGCLGYDCFGAGQKIAQVTFKGKDWNQISENAEKMFEAYLIMRKLHEMKWYLTQAYCFQTNQSIKEEISSLIERIEQHTKLNAESLLALDLEIQRKAVNEYLATTSESVRMKVRENEKENNFKIDINSRKSDYLGADLRKLNMKGADLRGACLIAANLSGIDFNAADLISVDMRDANIKGANLTNSMFLTQAQVNSAKGDSLTKLPVMINRPSHWSK